MFLKQQKTSPIDLRIFNPPVGNYTINNDVHQNKKQIITGSLYGPKQNDWQLGKFGTQARFKKSGNFVPGPGSYNQNKKKINTKLPKPHHPKPQNPFPLKSTPSIPSQKLRYQLLHQNEIEPIAQQAQYQQDNFSPNPIKKNPPAYTFPKSYYPQRSSHPLRAGLNDLEGRLQDIEDKKHVILNNNDDVEVQPNDEQLKKQRKQQIIQKMNIKHVPSLQLIQMRKKFTKQQTPGPGFYPYNLNTINNEFAQYNIPLTNPKSQRYPFQPKNYNQLGPGQYNINKKIQKPISFSFDRQKRVFSNEDYKNTPPPYPITNQKKQILFKRQQQYISPFGSGSTRFNFNDNLSNLGPGTYNIKSTLDNGKNKKKNTKIISISRSQSQSLKRSLSAGIQDTKVINKNLGNVSKLTNIDTLSNMYRNN